MRIAYLINQYPKVSHSFIRREIQALERQGVNVTRIALRGWDDVLVDDDDAREREHTRYALRDGAFSLIVAVVRLLLTHPIRLLQALELSVRMARRAERPLPVHVIYLVEACKIFLWLREQHIAHLHAHFGTNSAEVAMLVHALGGPQWSFTVHGPEEFDKPHSIGLAEKIRRSAFVVAISSYGRSQLYRLVDHIYWPKVHVVRCGLDRAYIDDFPVQAALPRRFVCVGRLCEQKGQLLLLEAARLLAAEGVDFELVLAGDGEMRAEIDSFIETHKLQLIVRVTGWISSNQVRNELLAARALVLPSFAEGLPVVIMEAMALRRPIISTFIAGIPELVRPGEHGWLVPAGDVKALVDAMRTCIHTPEDELTTMGDAARECVLRFHDANHEATKLEKLFQAIKSGHRFGTPEDARWK
jgi:colanic acid/amylovoran biosynthesis glycosyltransferase